MHPVKDSHDIGVSLKRKIPVPAALPAHDAVLYPRREPRVWYQALNGAYCCIGPHILMNKLEAQRKA